MEYFRYNCCWGKFCDHVDCPFWFQWICYWTATKAFSCQYRIQACAADQQPQQALQNWDVSYIFFICTLPYNCTRASLHVILSLIMLWLILFLFFAILFVEVFSLTKWSTAESRNRNYSTIGSSLVMLAFMSTGWVIFLTISPIIPTPAFSEGWNQYMHDLYVSRKFPHPSIKSCFPVHWYIHAVQILRLQNLTRIAGVLGGHLPYSLLGIFSAWCVFLIQFSHHGLNQPVPVHLREHVHWYASPLVIFPHALLKVLRCCCGELLICVPSHRRSQVYYPWRNARFQEVVGWIC